MFKHKIYAILCVMIILLTGSCTSFQSHGSDAPSSISVRSDGIDQYVRMAGFTPLVTRSSGLPQDILANTPFELQGADLRSELEQYSQFSRNPLLTLAIPSGNHWEDGIAVSGHVYGARADLSASLGWVFGGADAGYSSDFEESVEIHEVSFMRLRPEWLSRRPSRLRPESDIDNQMIVAEIMRANKFSIIRKYSSPTIAVNMKNTLANKLIGEVASVEIDAGKTEVRIVMNNKPLLLGVKLAALHHYVQRPAPTSRGNFEVFSMLFANDIVDAQDPKIYCQPVEITDERVGLNPTLNLRVDDIGEQNIIAREWGFPLRLDVIEAGELRLPLILANQLLLDIPPAEVAYCQVSFSDPKEFHLRRDARRPHNGGVPDGTRLVSHALGVSHYDLSCLFYDESVAKEYEQKLLRTTPNVHRQAERIDAQIQLPIMLAIGMRVEEWGALRPSNRAEAVRGFSAFLPLDTKIWTGAESAQQLVLLRGKSPVNICTATTPYLSASAGSTRVEKDALEGQMVSLVRHGESLQDQEILKRVLGEIGLYGITSADFIIRSSVSARLNPSGFSRHYPRGVWANTAGEFVVTDAFEIHSGDLEVQAITSDAAEMLRVRFASRFPGAECSVEGSKVRVNGGTLPPRDSLRFVTVKRLDDFCQPRPEPVFKSVGTAKVDSAIFTPFGLSGYGVSLSIQPGYSIRWSGSVGYELSSFPLNAQLIVGKVREGSPHLFVAEKGISRIISFDVNDHEVLEIRIGPVRILNDGIGCEVEWRLSARPLPIECKHGYALAPIASGQD